MWQGDVRQALATVVEADALTADFVSIAASAGHQAWLAASRLYAQKLELKGGPWLRSTYTKVLPGAGMRLTASVIFP